MKQFLFPLLFYSFPALGHSLSSSSDASLVSDANLTGGDESLESEDISEDWVFVGMRVTSLLAMVCLCICFLLFALDKKLTKHFHNKIFIHLLTASFLISLNYFIHSLIPSFGCNPQGYIFYYFYMVYLMWKIIWIFDLYMAFVLKDANTNNRKLLIYILLGYSVPAFFTLILELITPALQYPLILPVLK